MRTLLERALPRRWRRRRKRRWHSVSSTREYAGCPRRYRYGYIDRRPHDRPAPPSWRFGSVVHAGLEAAYRLAMDDPGSRGGDRRQAAIDAVHVAWEQLELGDDADYRDRAVWHTTRSLALDALSLSNAKILGVEVVLRDRLSEIDRVAGVADLILERAPGTIEIVDHKVTEWQATPEQLAGDFQLNLYGYLAKLRWPSATTVLATHHYPIGPAVVTTELDPARMGAAIRRVLATAQVIANDRHFWPVPGPRCHHCPWQPSCPDGTALLERLHAGQAHEEEPRPSAR